MGMYPDETTIEIDGKIVAYPGLKNGKFSSGSFTNPEEKPSFIPAESINLILDNLADVITRLGKQPSNNLATQLADALLAALPDLPQGAFARAARVPQSPAMNGILDTGWYLWSNAATTGYPAGGAATDFYALEVLSGPLGDGCIIQHVWDLSLGPYTGGFSWTRQSANRGNSWTDWVNSTALLPMDSTDANSAKTGTVIFIKGNESEVVTKHAPAVGGTGARWWNILSFGSSTRLTQIAQSAYIGQDDYTFGALFQRRLHDTGWSAWVNMSAPPVKSVYFQGPHDAAPSVLYPGTSWSDVTSEEANLGRRCEGVFSGSMHPGTPAVLSVSVASGVPTITVVSGGSGYLGGSSGNLTLAITGSCITQMLAHATVAGGVITGIVVDTAGASYTSGQVAVYDNVIGHADLVQKHYHTGYVNNMNASVAYTSAQNCFQGNGTINGAYDTAQAMRSDGIDGTPRGGVETSGPWITVKKWRRVA